LCLRKAELFDGELGFLCWINHAGSADFNDLVGDDLGHLPWETMALKRSFVDDP
jgi:hypothetical protein